MNNNVTIKQGTITFWIKENTVKYNDNKDLLIFTVNPDGGSILMDKDVNNNLHVAFVVIGKGRIDLNYNVSNLEQKIAHMVALTRDINDKLSLYIDGKPAIDKNIQFK